MRSGGLKIKNIISQDDKSKPLFTIITICKNSGYVIELTIKSIINQLYKNVEYFIIDGNSSDNTIEIIKKYNDNITYWLSENDAGISDAWNKGIKMASGDYILLLNAGDTYSDDFLLYISNIITKDKIYCSHAEFVTADDKIVGKFYARPWKLFIGMAIPHNWAIVPAWMYKDLGYYKNMPFSMDYDWFYRYYKKYGHKGFVVINKTFGRYHLGGLSDIHYKDGIRANIQVKKENHSNILFAYLIYYLVCIKDILIHRERIKNK